MSNPYQTTDLRYYMWEQNITLGGTRGEVGYTLFTTNDKARTYGGGNTSLTNNVNYLYLEGNREGDAESYNTTVYGSYTYSPAGRWGIRYDDNNVAPDEHIWKVCYKGTDEGENGKPYYEITNTQWLTYVPLGRSTAGYANSSLPVEQNGPSGPWYHYIEHQGTDTDGNPIWTVTLKAEGNTTTNQEFYTYYNGSHSYYVYGAYYPNYSDKYSSYYAHNTLFGFSLANIDLSPSYDAANRLKTSGIWSNNDDGTIEKYITIKTYPTHQVGGGFETLDGTTVRAPVNPEQYYLLFRQSSAPTTNSQVYVLPAGNWSGVGPIKWGNNGAKVDEHVWKIKSVLGKDNLFTIQNMSSVHSNHYIGTQSSSNSDGLSLTTSSYGTYSYVSFVYDSAKDAYQMKIHKEDDTDYDDNTDSDLCYVHLNTSYAAIGYLGYYPNETANYNEANTWFVLDDLMTENTYYFTDGDVNGVSSFYYTENSQNGVSHSITLNGVVYTGDYHTLGDSYKIGFSNGNNFIEIVDDATKFRFFENYTNPDMTHTLELSFSITQPTSSSGAGGDPYIVTLDNKLYKMQNFEGYARMIQGSYLDKLFTINVSSKMSSQKFASYAEKFVLDKLDGCQNGVDEFTSGNYLNENEAFFDRLYLKWGDESILIDMDNLKILENESNFEVSGLEINSGKSFKDINVMDHYKVLEETSIEIHINDITVVVSNIDNPQVRTAFRLNNGHLIKNPSGALVNTLFNKDMKLKKITDTKAITRVVDRKPRRITTELYITTTNKQQKKEIPIY